MKKDLAHHQAPLESLYKAFLTLKTEAEVADFLSDLCTPTEVAAFADRWHAANLLSLGKSQRDVAFQTGISLATVTRVARFLSRGAGGYKSVLKKLSHTHTA